MIFRRCSQGFEAWCEDGLQAKKRVSKPSRAFFLKSNPLWSRVRAHFVATEGSVGLASRLRVPRSSIAVEESTPGASRLSLSGFCPPESRSPTKEGGRPQSDPPAK